MLQDLDFNRMMNVHDFELVLLRMSELLDDCGQEEWASSLLCLLYRARREQRQVLSEVRKMFGGLGSLDELSLSRHGRPLQLESAEFEALRAQLFDMVFFEERDALSA